MRCTKLPSVFESLPVRGSKGTSIDASHLPEGSRPKLPMHS